jgi:hypothetical protein
MKTSYLVRCPHPDCHHFGSLLPCAKIDAWHGEISAMPAVMFRCPKCKREWRARMVGEDVRPLPLEPAAR